MQRYFWDWILILAMFLIPFHVPDTRANVLPSIIVPIIGDNQDLVPVLMKRCLSLISQVWGVWLGAQVLGVQWPIHSDAWPGVVVVMDTQAYSQQCQCLSRFWGTLVAWRRVKVQFQIWVRCLCLWSDAKIYLLISEKPNNVWIIRQILAIQKKTEKHLCS